jgi:transcriptional regulatory protein LevR
VPIQAPKNHEHRRSYKFTTAVVTVIRCVHGLITASAVVNNVHNLLQSTDKHCRGCGCGSSLNDRP